MDSVTLSAAIGAAVLVAGLLGLALQRLLPDSFTTGPSRDMIGAVAGLLTLLCALVLGLLIWTAYGVYAGQTAAMQTLAGKVLQLDLALADYGPEMAPMRTNLKQLVTSTVSEIENSRQSNAQFVAENLHATLRNLGARQKALAALQPQTDVQKAAVANATAAVAAIGQTRLQMALALSNTVSLPLVLIVAAWAGTIFLGYGLTSKAHPMTFVALVAGAGAIASAFFLILDLSAPYNGMFHVSPAAIEQVLTVVGKPPT